EAFVGRVRAFEWEARVRAQVLLDDLGATVDLMSGAVAEPAVVKAARTAFVRLYEGGRLIRSEQVTDICPRCETVVDPGDSDSVETPATLCRLRLRLVDKPAAPPTQVALIAPELLAVAVAIAVPVDHPAAG